MESPRPVPPGRVVKSGSNRCFRASGESPHPVSRIDSPTQGADYGKRWLDEYIAKRYHKPSDEYSPDWDVSGTMQDLQLYYDVGFGVANSSRWPTSC